MEEQESDPGQIEYINRLIEQLDEKISSLGSQRTDPDAIASALANQLSGYFSVLVNNFLSKKEEEEAEAAKPRKIMEEPTPIDIVSVSPQAAGQIASALEAAGIGKYKLNITQVNTKSDDESSGLLDSLIGALGTVVSFLSGLLTNFLIMLGPFLLSAFGSMMRYIVMNTISIRRSIGRWLRRNGSRLTGGVAAVSITALLASDSISVFDTAQKQFTDLKKRADDDPHSLMNYMESENAGGESEQLDLFKAAEDIGKFDVVDDAASADTKAKEQMTEWGKTEAGRSYVKNLLKSPDYSISGTTADKKYGSVESEAEDLDARIETFYPHLKGDELDNKKREIYKAILSDSGTSREEAFASLAKTDKTLFDTEDFGERDAALAETAAYLADGDGDDIETVTDKNRGRILMDVLTPTGPGMNDMLKGALKKSSEGDKFIPPSESLYDMEDLFKQKDKLPDASQENFDKLLHEVTDKHTSYRSPPSRLPNLGSGDQFDDIPLPSTETDPHSDPSGGKLMLALQHASSRDHEHTKELEAVRDSLLGISKDTGESPDSDVPEEDDDLNFGVETLRGTAYA